MWCLRLRRPRLLERDKAMLQRLAIDTLLTPPAARLVLSFRSPRVFNRNEYKATQARLRSRHSYRRRNADKKNPKMCVTTEIDGAFINRLVREGRLPDDKATDRKAVEEAFEKWFWFVRKLR
jgi:hypothetical protein